MFDLIATIIILIATTFSIIGVIGYIRLPDVYTRLHATGKVGALGVTLLLVATALVVPAIWSRVVVLILFLLVAGPVTAHVLSSAAYRLGVGMQDATRDDLAK